MNENKFSFRESEGSFEVVCIAERNFCCYDFFNVKVLVRALDGTKICQTFTSFKDSPYLKDEARFFARNYMRKIVKELELEKEIAKMPATQNTSPKENSCNAIEGLIGMVNNEMFRVQCAKHFGIKQAIFNPPATIVMWADGTKTVVKAQNEAFDPEKGLAMAFARKALGNKHGYYGTIRKHTKKYRGSEE